MAERLPVSLEVLQLDFLVNAGYQIALFFDLLRESFSYLHQGVFELAILQSKSVDFSLAHLQLLVRLRERISVSSCKCLRDLIAGR